MRLNNSTYPIYCFVKVESKNFVGANWEKFDVYRIIEVSPIFTKKNRCLRNIYLLS